MQVDATFSCTPCHRSVASVCCTGNVTLAASDHALGSTQKRFVHKANAFVVRTYELWSIASTRWRDTKLSGTHGQALGHLHATCGGSGKEACLR
eukprot:6471471-Amphidinium_carterae.1